MANPAPSQDHNQYYYGSYCSRYQSPEDCYPEELLAACLKALALDTPHRNSIRILDIGAGDWSKCHHAPSEPAGCALPSQVMMLWPSYPILRAFGSVRVEIVLLDPYFQNISTSYSDGALSIQIQGQKQTLREFIATNPAPFDVILSVHGLYGHLEDSGGKPMPDHLRQAAKELRALAKDDAVIGIVHSSQDSVDKKLKFQPPAGAHSPSLDMFRDTHAEALLEHLRLLFFTREQVRIGALSYPVKELDITNPGFIGFSNYFFRLGPKNTQSAIFAKRLADYMLSKAQKDSDEIQIPAVYARILCFTSAIRAFKSSPLHFGDMLRTVPVRTIKHPRFCAKDLQGALEKICAGLDEAVLTYARMIDVQFEDEVEWGVVSHYRRFPEYDSGSPRTSEDAHLAIITPMLHLAPPVSDPDDIRAAYSLLADPKKLDHLTTRPVIMAKTTKYFTTDHDHVKLILDSADFTFDGKTNWDSLEPESKTVLAALWAERHTVASALNLRAPSFVDPLFKNHTNKTSLESLVEALHTRYKTNYDRLNPPPPAAKSSVQEKLDNIRRDYDRALMFMPHMKQAGFDFSCFLRAQYLQSKWIQLLIPCWSRTRHRAVAVATIILDTSKHPSGMDLSPVFGIFSALATEIDRVLTECQTYRSLTRSHEAAIMSRNMSHNLGSHALANSKFFASVGLLDEVQNGIQNCSKEEVQKARGRLQSFNQYCQGRLDFIARKLSEDGDKPEPLFLLSDVIRGFMSQHVLLDTLLDDNGFRTGNIELRLHQGSSEEIWKYVKPSASVHGELDLPKTSILYDPLVGITGGMTGCHALYAFIENLLRNAAKYSKPDWHGAPPKLELHIEFKEIKVGETECYRLHMWENLTNDANNVATSTVREGLGNNAINNEGIPIRGGHGVQEMKLCAEYIAGNLAFRSDNDLLLNPPISDSEDGEYYRYIQDKSGKKPIDNDKLFVSLVSPKLRAYRAPKSDSVSKSERLALVYEMLIPKPILLGLTCVRTVKNEKNERVAGYGHICKPDHPCVKRYNDLDEMGMDNAHFGLIIAHDDDDETITFTLKELAKKDRHTTLPYRLMVVTRHGHMNRWRNALNAAQANGMLPMSRFYPPSKDQLELSINLFEFHNNEAQDLAQTPILPCHRVHVIAHESFFPCISNGAHINEIKPKVWQQLILEVYEAWIRIWKGTPPDGGKRWQMLIGFERDNKYIDRWIEPLKILGDTAQELFDVYVRSKHANEEPRTVARKNKYIDPDSVPPLPPAGRDCLVFDNHGNVFGREYIEYNRFWHRFGGNELSLFQMLDSPPATKFGFAFFMLSLLEASLTNIVTLDERVADATIKEKFGRRMLDLGLDGLQGGMRLAGIHPLYSLAQSADAPPQTPATDAKMELRKAVAARFITPNIEEPMMGWQKLSPLLTPPLLASEGIRFTADGGICALQELCLKELMPSLEILNAPDAIIIHEGITDFLSKDGRWTKGDHRRLYSLMPAVIRTSGRGRQSRELGDELPFIELNVLSDSCYGSLNKVKLARAVLNATGEMVMNRKESRAT